MTTTQHTPGPWKHVKDSVSVFAPGQPRRKICDAAWQTINVGEARANAALIAAAPDLLSACEAAEANLSPQYCGEHLVMKLLRAAILKAGGKLRDDASGQDRESYSDTQDRKSYSVS